MPPIEPSPDLSVKRLCDLEYTEVIEFNNLVVCHIKASRLSALYLQSFFASSCNLYLSLTFASLTVILQTSSEYGERTSSNANM